MRNLKESILNFPSLNFIDLIEVRQAKLLIVATENNENVNKTIAEESELNDDSESEFDDSIQNWNKVRSTPEKKNTVVTKTTFTVNADDNSSGDEWGSRPQRSRYEKPANMPW